MKKCTWYSIIRGVSASGTNPTSMKKYVLPCWVCFGEFVWTTVYDIFSIIALLLLWYKAFSWWELMGCTLCMSARCITNRELRTYVHTGLIAGALQSNGAATNRYYTRMTVIIHRLGNIYYGSMIRYRYRYGIPGILLPIHGKQWNLFHSKLYKIKKKTTLESNIHITIR